METFNSTDLNFSDSAIEHFSKVLKERGKGIGIRLGIKEAGCSGYEYTFDFVDDIIDDFITYEKGGCKIFIDSNEFFQAKSTLESLIEKNSNEEIKKEAEDMLNEINTID